MRDLSTMEGIEAYINGELREALQQAVTAHRETPPCGVVIATTNGQQTFETPQPCIFGGFGNVVDHVKGLLLKNARKLRATGVIYVEADGRDVLVHLEHKEFGDQTWRTQVIGANIGEFGEPTTPETITRFLPRRYMN